MRYISTYRSPLGDILMASDGRALTGLWFVGQKYEAAGLGEGACEEPGLPVFREACSWLDEYFAGGHPEGQPALSPSGTPFQRAVWDELARIPYGATVSYGEVASRIAARRGSPTSARAVGAAVGRNPISILVPCHRVTGTGGALTGYAGGLWRKRALLALEGRGIVVGEEPAERSEQLLVGLTDVWERSARATHAFLAEEDVSRLRAMVPQAIAEVPRLLVARRAGCLAGFAGADGTFLEMLFVDAADRGAGVGRLLLERAVELLGVTELSVNEQNPQAVGFYEHMGFSVFRRTETDSQGDPFPLLYMRR